MKTIRPARLRRSRGISSLETTVLVAAVVVVAIVGYRNLGTAYKCGIQTGIANITGASAPPECGNKGNSPQLAVNDNISSLPTNGGFCVRGPDGRCIGGNGCFVAGTPVWTDRGPVPIETVAVGTVVLAGSPEDGRVGWRRVTRLFHPHADQLIELTVISPAGTAERIGVTPEHLIFVEGRGFVPAEAIDPAHDRLRDSDGRPLRIASALLVPADVAVFNFEVEELHTYFVGRTAAWVHNACYQAPPAAPEGYNPANGNNHFHITNPTFNFFSDAAGTKPVLKFEVDKETPGTAENVAKQAFNDLLHDGQVTITAGPNFAPGLFGVAQVLKQLPGTDNTQFELHIKPQEDYVSDGVNPLVLTMEGGQIYIKEFNGYKLIKVNYSAEAKPKILSNSDLNAAVENLHNAYPFDAATKKDIPAPTGQMENIIASVAETIRFKPFLQALDKQQNCKDCALSEVVKDIVNDWSLISKKIANGDDKYEFTLNDGTPKTFDKKKMTDWVYVPQDRGGNAPQCFVAGTLVMTESGLQPIESIDVGTRVLARDQNGDEVTYKPVVRTYARTSRALVRLTIADQEGLEETFEVTANHRLFSQQRGWVTAGMLVPGEDTLLDANGGPLTITALLALPLQVPVFNLEVADFHTYFVGEHGMWAHNRGGDSTTGSTNGESSTGTPIDNDFIKSLNDKPYFDYWTYMMLKYGGTIVNLGLKAIPGASDIGGAVKGAAQFAWDIKRYKKYGEILKKQQDILLDALKQPGLTPAEKSMLLYALQQINKQLLAYQQLIKETSPPVPIVGTIATIVNQSKNAKNTKHKVTKHLNKLKDELDSDFDKAGIERKTYSKLLLDEAFLYENKVAKLIVDTVYGPEAAKKIGQTWKDIHALTEDVPKRDSAAEALTKLAKRENDFIASYFDKQPKIHREQPDPNAAPSTSKWSKVKEKLKFTFIPSPKITLETVPGVAQPPGPLVTNPPSLPLKYYDPITLANKLGDKNIGPATKVGKLINKLKSLTPGLSDSQFPDKRIVDALSDKFAATPAPRKKQPKGKPTEDNQDTSTDPNLSTPSTPSTVPSTPTAGPSNSSPPATPVDPNDPKGKKPVVPPIVTTPAGAAPSPAGGSPETPFFSPLERPEDFDFDPIHDITDDDVYQTAPSSPVDSSHGCG